MNCRPEVFNVSSPLFILSKPFACGITVGTRRATMSDSKLKIVLISPKGPLYRHRGGIWKKSLRYQPLTLTTLAALIPPELPVDVRLIDEGIADVPLELEADLVGLTVITGT